MSKKICGKICVLLIFAVFIGSQPVYAAPPLHFTELPGVWDMFFPPPPPMQTPDWDNWEPELPELTPQPEPPEPCPTCPLESIPEPPPMPTPEPAPMPAPTPGPIPAPMPEPSAPAAPEMPPPAVAHAYPRGLSDISGHWAEGIIIRAFDRGMVNIYANREVRPNQSITRGEFALALDRWISANSATLQAMGFAFAGDHLPVVGVPAYHPFRANIDSLAAMGLVGGNTPFMADEHVQRQEATVILLNLFMRLPNSSFNLDYFTRLNVTEVLSRYEDNNRIASWARDAVAVVTDRGFMGAGVNNFRPTDSLTRAEAYAILQNIEQGLR